VYSENLQKYVPPNFDLAKYESAANMELTDWFENLWVRMGYRATNLVVGEEEAQALKALNQINISRGLLTDGPYYKIMYASFELDQTTQLSIIRDISYIDLFHKADLLKTDELAKLYSETSSFVTSMIDKDRYGKLAEPVRIGGLINEHSLSWLEVDMDCSDSEIKEAFSAWLIRSKQKQKAEKKPKRREHKLNNLNKVTLRKWHDERVLAYIDLAMWNELNGTDVTNNIYGKILFPDLRDIRSKEKKVEDTIQQYALELTSPDFLRRVFKLLSDADRKKISQKTS
jgi:uncharacterized protein DUF6387